MSTKRPTDVAKLDIPVYKVVIIGDSHCGKSSILLKFAENTFKNEHHTTIGVDMKSRYIKIDETNVKLHIWDTAGQERFRSIIRTYYETASGIVLVFDLSNRESFNDLEYWIDELRIAGKDKCPIILVGNKSDLYFKRIITHQEILNFVNGIGLNMAYLEVSAKNDINVNNIFIDLTTKILYDNNGDEGNEMRMSKILTRKESDILEFDKYNVVKKDDASSCCIIS